MLSTAVSGSARRAVQFAKEIIMSRFLASLVLASALTPMGATAEQGTARGLSWDCGRPGAPTYSEVRDGFGIADFHRAHHTSLHLRQIIHRACARDVSKLLIVADPNVTRAPRYLAERVN